MEKQGKMLYRVKKADITRVGKVLADAFRQDPLWNKIYEGEADFEKKYRAFFEVPVRYCLKYGEVYAPSEELEGIVAWVPGKYANMTAWRILISGALGAAIRMGANASKKMRPIFKPITEDRDAHMAGHNFLYLFVVGVATEFQGRGLQLYLETEAEENVKMYEHFGFKLLKRITLPIVDLPMWEMFKEPKA